MIDYLKMIMLLYACSLNVIKKSFKMKDHATHRRYTNTIIEKQTNTPAHHKHTHTSKTSILFLTLLTMAVKATISKAEDIRHSGSNDRMQLS